MRNIGHMDIKIIYEDNHIIVIEKPVNIAVQKDESGDIDVLTLLKENIKHRFEKPGNVFVGLVHRLDRPVGGLMVFAKTSKAAGRLSELVRSREFRKIYFAVIHGVPDKTEGKLRHFLYKDTKNNIVRSVDEKFEGAKEALLTYKVIDSIAGLSLVKVNLHTGRSHQIRVQFSTEGYPLYGDQKYGRGITKQNRQIALWSREISFAHPTLNEEMKFLLNPPSVEPWDLFNIR